MKPAAAAPLLASPETNPDVDNNLYIQKLLTYLAELIAPAEVQA